MGNEQKALTDLIWTWTQKAMGEMDEIERVARAASKRASSLAEKIECQRIATRAREGRATVTRIFGSSGKAWVSPRSGG